MFNFSMESRQIVGFYKIFVEVLMEVSKSFSVQQELVESILWIKKAGFQD